MDKELNEIEIKKTKYACNYCNFSADNYKNILVHESTHSHLENVIKSW